MKVIKYLMRNCCIYALILKNYDKKIKNHLKNKSLCIKSHKCEFYEFVILAKYQKVNLTIYNKRGIKMKKLVATFCLLGSTLALSACDSTDMGYVDTAPPYAVERTATHEQDAAPAAVATPTRVAPAEKVFQRAQTK